MSKGNAVISSLFGSYPCWMTKKRFGCREFMVKKGEVINTVSQNCHNWYEQYQMVNLLRTQWTCDKHPFYASFSNPRLLRTFLVKVPRQLLTCNIEHLFASYFNAPGNYCLHCWKITPRAHWPYSLHIVCRALCSKAHHPFKWLMNIWLDFKLPR